MTGLNFSQNNAFIFNYCGNVSINQTAYNSSLIDDSIFVPCEDNSSLDLMFNGCDNAYSTNGSVDSFLSDLSEWFYSSLNSILNSSSSSQSSNTYQPSYVNQQGCGMVEQFFNQIMNMLMSIFNSTVVDSQPEAFVPEEPAVVDPQPEPSVPVEPSVVDSKPQTLNLEYGDTDYAVQYENGHFTAQVGGVDLELTVSDNGHVQTVVNDQLYDLGAVTEEADGTFSIDESTGAEPVNSKVADYQLNFEGIDYAVTQHSNGTFTVQVGDEDLPISLKEDGTVVVTANGDNHEIGKIKDDNDGTFSVEQ